MDSLAVDKGSRSVAVKGKKLHYKTLQMTDDVCTCKYVYEGNVRNPITKISLCPACNTEPEHHFHQIVGNCYDSTMNQTIPSHSDESALLSSNTDIVPVTPG